MLAIEFLVDHALLTTLTIWFHCLLLPLFLIRSHLPVVLSVVCLYITSNFCFAAFRILSLSLYFFKFIFLPLSHFLLFLGLPFHIRCYMLITGPHISLRLCSLFFNLFSFSSADWMTLIDKCSNSLIPVRVTYVFFNSRTSV